MDGNDFAIFGKIILLIWPEQIEYLDVIEPTFTDLATHAPGSEGANQESRIFLSRAAPFRYGYGWREHLRGYRTLIELLVGSYVLIEGELSPNEAPR